MASTIVNPQALCLINAGISPGIANVTGSQAVGDSTNIAPGVGTAAGKADGVYFASFSIVSGTPLVIDFTSIKDIYGNSITAAHIVSLKITNTGGGGTLSHGGGTNPIYSAQPLAIGNGDSFFHTFNAAGLAVVGSSAQNLDITASTGTVTCTVSALVRSA